jgi:homoserine dehydrogenase
MFYGRGAGALPTGSAVVGDVIDVARNLLQTARGATESQHRAKPIRADRGPADPVLRAARRRGPAGVLAEVATTFGTTDVSIAQVWQEGLGDSAQLVLITHRAARRPAATVDALAVDRPGVRSVASVLRVESEVFGS